MHENEIARHVVDVAYQIHTKLGPGLLESVYQRIMLTYLRLANCKLGLLINFGQEKIKDGISRVVNGLEDELPLE